MHLLLYKLLASRHMEYFKLDRDLLIRETSAQAQRFVECPAWVERGQDIRLGFPELFGVEDILMAVLAAEQDSFTIHAIVHTVASGELLHLDLQIISDRVEPIEQVEQAQDLVKRQPEPGLLLLVEDVTPQMQLEQSLVQSTNEMSLLLNSLATSKAYINQIVSSMADGLLVTTQAGIICAVNQAALALLEYSEAELMGNSIAQLMAHEADAAVLPQILQLSLEAEAAVDADWQEANWREVEILCLTKLGKKRKIAFTCSVLPPDKGRSPEFIYVFRDVTERHETEQRIFVEYTITRILSEATSLQQAAPQILQLICRGLGWVLGELWLPQPGSEEASLACVDRCFNPASSLSSTSRSSGNAHPEMAEFLSATESLRFAQGVGFPGRIWASGTSAWISDVGEADNFLRSQLAQTAELHAAFGFPLRSGNEVLGVMIFLTHEVKPPDANLLRTASVIGNQLGQFIKRKQVEVALQQSQQQTERLLLNIFPPPIADRLKQAGQAGSDPKQPTGIIAEHFAAVTVLFADIVGFTQIAAALSPIELVDRLNQIFSSFDQLTERHGLEKIKTIGDAYMVVGGVPQPRPDHAEAIAEMAIEMQTVIAQFNREHRQTLNIRIGIHSGSVVAGVIGTRKLAYDLWGDTVNIASRMESHGSAGEIQVSASTCELLQKQYWFQPRGEIQIKGKGAMVTYWLKGRKPGV
jgi:adenylate cyclase